jgi:hypothetical protein
MNRWRRVGLALFYVASGASLVAFVVYLFRPWE